MYVAVKGGEQAIDNAHAWLAEKRRGDTGIVELSVAQIREQMAFAVDRVMMEGSLYDPDLAALAIKQAQGDLVEAVFLVRAYRATVPRFGYSQPVDTAKMFVQRRVSATFKDIPGGQILGPTVDYTHRLLDFELASEPDSSTGPTDLPEEPVGDAVPRVVELFSSEDLVEREVKPSGDPEPFDITRQPMSFPGERDQTLQALARADEGALLALGYSVQRGFGAIHPFAGEIRQGEVEVEFYAEEIGFAIVVGELVLTECDLITQFHGSELQPPQFTRGYGLVFGCSERKAISMGLLDRALRAKELGEPANHPAQSHEFVMTHVDNVEAMGFVSHLKLPHYIDFQAELNLIRSLRQEHKVTRLRSRAND